MKNLKILMMFLTIAAFSACADKGTEDPKPEVEDGTYVGKLVVDQNDGTNYEQEDVSVEFTLNENGTADIKMLKVAFNKKMKEKVTIDMTITSVIATKTSEGYSVTGDNIIPLSGTTPFPVYTISNLTGNVTTQNITLDMMCGEYPLTYTGIAKTE